MQVARDWLRADEIELDRRLATKREVLEESARLLAARLGGSPAAILDALWHRESIGSTALGLGVALPHARLAELAAPVAAFLRLRQPVDFDAPDDKPVEFVLALLLPQTDAQRQLNLLAAIAGCFAERDFRERLLGAATAAQARALLDGGVSR